MQGGSVAVKKKLQDRQHCQRVNICLVGSNRFQNALLVSNLKEILGCRASFVLATSLSDFPLPPWVGLEASSLVYVDCHAKSCAEIETLFNSIRQVAPPNSLFALYNLGDGTGCEITLLNYGVRGCFYANDTPEDVCHGTRCMLNGEVWFSRKMMSEAILAGSHPAPHRPSGAKTPAGLSARERQILSILASGATNETIAAGLYISVHTVRTHLYHIYRKINVDNRMQASIWASENL